MTKMLEAFPKICAQCKSCSPASVVCMFICAIRYLIFINKQCLYNSTILLSIHVFLYIIKCTCMYLMHIIEFVQALLHTLVIMSYLFDCMVHLSFLTEKTFQLRPISR